MPAPAAPRGLTADEIRARVADGRTNAAARATSRSVWSILRTNLFNFFNNLLSVIGAGLVALGRYNDAFTSVGLGLIGTVQEVRAKRQLDRISVMAQVPVTVVRDGTQHRIPPRPTWSRGTWSRWVRATRSSSTAPWSVTSHSAWTSPC